MEKMMKPLAGCLAGMGLGWWLAGAADRPVPTGSASRGNSPRAAEFSNLRPDANLVLVAKSQFSQTLQESLSAENMVNTYFTDDTEPPHGYSPLTSRLGLDQEQVASMHRILKQAALDRLAWEKAHAKVKPISPGEWEIRIPGDGGVGDRKLRDELTQAFGSEMAGKIERSSDLDGFFNLQDIDPDFRHGTLRLRARRESLGQSVPSWLPKERVRVAVQWDEHIATFHLTSGSYTERRLANRLGRLIGGVEVIQREAPAHPIGRGR